MTIAFDAQTGRSVNADDSFTHTPVGTPRGVLVLAAAWNTTVDLLVDITYGGVAMSQVALSPLDYGIGSEEDGFLHAFILGSGIPTGAQTVVVDVNGTPNIRLNIVTLTAAADTEVADTTTADVGAGGSANPSIALTISENCFCAGAIVTGQDTVGGIAPGTGMTQIGGELDFGPQVFSAIYRTTNPATNTTIDWTAAAEDYAAFAVAIREASAPPPTFVPRVMVF